MKIRSVAVLGLVLCFAFCLSLPSTDSIDNDFSELIDSEVFGNACLGSILKASKLFQSHVKGSRKSLVDSNLDLILDSKSFKKCQDLIIEKFISVGGHGSRCCKSPRYTLTLFDQVISPDAPLRQVSFDGNHKLPVAISTPDNKFRCAVELTN